jgi:uncharacterized membrane protein YhfC
VFRESEVRKRVNKKSWLQLQSTVTIHAAYGLPALMNVFIKWLSKIINLIIAVRKCLKIYNTVGAWRIFFIV